MTLLLRRVVRLLAVTALAVGAFAVAGSVPAQAKDTATVSVLHAIPGATVDVYANGQELLKNFTPGTLTSPQMLPAGTYDLKIVKAGAGAKGAAIAELKDATVPAGANVTVVAHLTAKGSPALTAYANDVSTVAAGKARIIVRHDAAAPAVDVRANGTPVFRDLTNPNQKMAEVPAGTIKADVVLAGTSTVAIGPAMLSLKEGTTTIVYAWGSAADKNLALATQTISGMSGAPTGVPGGTGGEAAGWTTTTPAWAMSLVLFGAGGVALSAARLARRRVTVRR